MSIDGSGVKIGSVEVFDARRWSTSSQPPRVPADDRRGLISRFKLILSLTNTGYDEDCRFDSDEGKASLADAFKGCSQLLVYHFMFGPDYTAGVSVLLGDRGRLQRVRVRFANHDVA